LARSTAQAAVDGLENRGLLAVRRTGNVSGKATGENTYTLWVEGESGVPVLGDELSGFQYGPVAASEPAGEGPNPLPIIGLGGLGGPYR
jgi:hypothetical protein